MVTDKAKKQLAPIEVHIPPQLYGETFLRTTETHWLLVNAADIQEVRRQLLLSADLYDATGTTVDSDGIGGIMLTSTLLQAGESARYCAHRLAFE